MEPQQHPPTGDITRLLRVWGAGGEQAFEELLPLVYDELHRMALRHLTRERGNVSMQATGLVNEVCIRMLGWDPVPWQNRAHFFGVSAQMMRHVLVDIARRRRAGRRGGRNAVRIALEDCELAVEPADADIISIDRALTRLAGEDPRKARVVELRFFGGLSMEETAEALGISLRTAHNDWEFARAWLYRALDDGGDA
jgi:RNA polymerase sigma factor (TIGR02999 family)